MLSQNLASWPVDPTLVAAFLDARAAWDAAYPELVAARAAAQAATAAKDAARGALEESVRPLVRQLQALLEVSNADRAKLGITVKDTARRAVPPPKGAPRVLVESGQRLTHRLRFTDAAASNRRGKPPGTIGAEVWVALVPAGEAAPPPGDSYKFLSVSSRGSLAAEFPGAAAGKTACYVLRWVSTRGEKGPWSEVARATVAA